MPVQRTASCALLHTAVFRPTAMPSWKVSKPNGLTMKNIDQILFNQENNALLAQADGFRADIQAINSSMTGDTSKVMETEKLLHFAERGSMLAEFDDLLFTKFVDSVRVDSRHQVSFVLKCGLTFKERIGE